MQTLDHDTITHIPRNKENFSNLTVERIWFILVVLGGQCSNSQSIF